MLFLYFSYCVVCCDLSPGPATGPSSLLPVCVCVRYLPLRERERQGPKLFVKEAESLFDMKEEEEEEGENVVVPFDCDGSDDDDDDRRGEWEWP